MSTAHKKRELSRKSRAGHPGPKKKERLDCAQTKPKQEGA
jgi:hypothetical protein